MSVVSTPVSGVSSVKFGVVSIIQGNLLMADSVVETNTELAEVSKQLKDLNTLIIEKSKVANPFNGFGRAPGVIVGESPNNSRPFMVSALSKALFGIEKKMPGYAETCNTELDYASRCAAALGRPGYFVPLSASALEASIQKSDSGVDASPLVKEWGEMQAARPELDMDFYRRIVKDLTAGTATTGGTFVPGPGRGDLIDMLRQKSLFDGIPGITYVPLPGQGSMEFPTITSSATVSDYAESTATAESTPGTGLLKMEAKGYSGMIEMTERFLLFSQTMEGDAFARRELAYASQLKVDQDILTGQGGTAIKGIFNYSGITTQTASTVATDGNTLEMQDIDYLVAKMYEANVPVNENVVICTRARVWKGLKYRDDGGSRIYSVAAATTYGGGRTMMLYDGMPIVLSNQIPNTRVKGSGTDLTSVLAFVPSELYIGRLGAMEMSMTNSHASNFSSGIFSLRGTQFVDAIPAHEASFGLVDQILNA
jgi:HK97 family phage major capsid protein